MRELAAVAIAAAIATPAALAAPVTLFRDSDFRGEGLIIDGPVRDLRPQAFHREGSSLVVEAGDWELCTEPDFKGRCRVFGPGRYATLDNFEDAVESVREVVKAGPGKWVARGAAPVPAPVAVPAPAGAWGPPAIELFANSYFNGPRIALSRDVADLRGSPVGDEVSSLMVHEGSWEICMRPGFEGRCRVVGPGRHPDLGRFNNRVDSIRRVG